MRRTCSLAWLLLLLTGCPQEPPADDDNQSSKGKILPPSDESAAGSNATGSLSGNAGADAMSGARAGGGGVAGSQNAAGSAGAAGTRMAGAAGTGTSASDKPQASAGSAGSAGAAGSAGTGSGAGIAMCAGPGGECSEMSDCCNTDLCVQNVCASACDANSDCKSGCCFQLSSGGSVCAPANLCPTGSPAGPPQTSTTCSSLVLVADDGTYLDKASSSSYASDGVCNDYSSYGSAYGSSSIFNTYGTYGSEYSSKSAYNKYTSTPPRLYCDSSDRVMNPVTKNTFLANGIDPDDLCDTLAANGY